MSLLHITPFWNEFSHLLDVIHLEVGIPLFYCGWQNMFPIMFASV